MSDKSKIKYFIMDVDGTLTDGKIYYGENGDEYKAFDIKDGLGIHDILIPSGIIPIIITGRESKIVERRAAELGITEIYQGVKDKVKKLHEIVVDLSDVCYIGDDLNDIQCMLRVKSTGGIVACPNDAVNEVKKIANYISRMNGGNGAVRDIIDKYFFWNI